MTTRLVSPQRARYTHSVTRFPPGQGLDKSCHLWIPRGQTAADHWTENDSLPDAKVGRRAGRCWGQQCGKLFLGGRELRQSPALAGFENPGVSVSRTRERLCRDSPLGGAPRKPDPRSRWICFHGGLHSPLWSAMVAMATRGHPPEQGLRADGLGSS